MFHPENTKKTFYNTAIFQVIKSYNSNSLFYRSIQVQSSDLQCYAKGTQATGCQGRVESPNQLKLLLLYSHHLYMVPVLTLKSSSLSKFLLLPLIYLNDSMLVWVKYKSKYIFAFYSKEYYSRLQYTVLREIS